MRPFSRLTAGLVVTVILGCSAGRQHESTPPVVNPALAREVLADPALPEVLDQAEALLGTGLNAGAGYSEVWIRDLNTFIELALEVNDPEEIRSALETFCRFQGGDGNIPDGYVSRSRARVAYDYRLSPLEPDLLAHKNTVATDQETSFVQAVGRYVRVTGDRRFLRESIGGVTVARRLEAALVYLLNDRLDRESGLLWGGTTVDWGDVQPETEWGVNLDPASHRALDVYDNAMFVLALDSFLDLVGSDWPRADAWATRRDEVRRRIREVLWDSERGKFLPHVYLEGSPFPPDFDESAIWYHGGTAVAIEAGLLNRDEVLASLEAMRENVRNAGARSISLSVYPPYPKGFFKSPGMAPGRYQNGGEWPWYGGRMVQQLIRYGFVEEAYQELKPMVAGVVDGGGFREWWTPDGRPRGVPRYRGSAGVLGRAIEMLLDWAHQQPWGSEAGEAQTANAR